jgi:hypothetical protein
MASSIPGSRTNLYAGLTALTGASEPLEGVGVYRTGLWKEERAADRIIVANAVDIERDVMALAIPAPFREEFALLVQFEVYRTGDDVGYVEDRLWDLITAVEQHVMGDKTLAGAVNQAIPGTVEERSGPSANDEDTLIGMATLRLDCWARVHLN